MSEMGKKSRADNRAKVKRLTTADPHQKVDASSWTPPEPLNAGRKVYDKAKQRSATTKIYKAGGRVQGDRGPRRKDKSPRCDGGRMERASGGSCAPIAANAVHKHEKHDHKGEALTKLRRGGTVRTGNKSGNYLGGTRPTGGRVARAGGGRAYGQRDQEFHEELYGPQGELKGSPGGSDEKRRIAAMRAKPRRQKEFGAGNSATADDRNELRSMMPRARGGRTGKGKTNINIIIGRGGEHPQQPPVTMVPPPQQVTRPPMPAPPPGPPPGMPPGGPPGMPPGGPPGMPPGMPPPGMMGRKRGGRTIDVHMEAGAGSGEGRLEKIKRYGTHHS